jgi:tetratricopeptide (TPR) repeat protein
MNEMLEAKSTALGNIGLIYSAKGDLDEALTYHTQALAIHREIGHRQGEASDLGNIGLIYQMKGDLDKALDYLNEALVILHKYNLTYGRHIIEDIISKMRISQSDA